MGILEVINNTILNPVHQDRVRLLSEKSTRRAEQISELEKTLDNLSNILPFPTAAPWFLNGYLNIAASLREFHRRPYEVEIIIPESSLIQVATKAKENNYSLFSRKSLNKLSLTKKLDVYIQTSPEHILSEVSEFKEKGVPKDPSEKIKNRNLRLIQLDSRGKLQRHSHLLSYIDVRISYEITLPIDSPKQIVILPDTPRVVLHKEDFDSHSYYTTKSGKQIYCASLELIKLEKKARNNRVDNYDLRLLEEHARTLKIY